MAEMGSGRLVGPSGEKLTLKDLKEIVENDFKVNWRKSLDRLQVSWKALDAYFKPEFRALDLTTDRVTASTLHRQEQGKASSTIRNEINALGRSLNLAHRAGRISTVPYFPAPEVTAVREGFLTREDLKTVVAELPDYLRPVTWFA